MDCTCLRSAWHGIVPPPPCPVHRPWGNAFTADPIVWTGANTYFVSPQFLRLRPATPPRKSRKRYG